ncbi:YfiR family protein [Pseudomonadota bacterium]
MTSTITALSSQIFLQVKKVGITSLLLGLLLTPHTLTAAESTSIALENEIKAVYIYNFIRFTEWPDDTFSPAQSRELSILGNLSLLKTLKRDTFRKTAKDTSLDIHACQTPACLEKSHVLFIDSSQSRKLTKIITSLKNRPILTISDIPGFADKGGMIEMKKEKERVVFIVNLKAAFKAKLYISAQLLQLAELVETQP